MTFEEIFTEQGLYKAESFAKGVAFRISKNKITGNLELLTVRYSKFDDLLPTVETTLVYAELFKKQYELVLTIQSLFK